MHHSHSRTSQSGPAVVEVGLETAHCCARDYYTLRLPTLQPAPRPPQPGTPSLYIAATAPLALGRPCL
eukprot:scaffold46908_cov48-Phaeocystis_antarctica.AAC.3